MRSEGRSPLPFDWHPAADPVAVLEAQCTGLQLLIGELLVKNQELRFEIARLQEPRSQARDLESL